MRIGESLESRLDECTEMKLGETPGNEARAVLGMRLEQFWE